MNVPQALANELQLLGSIRGFGAKMKIFFFYPLSALLSKALGINPHGILRKFLSEGIEVHVENGLSPEKLKFKVPDWDAIKLLLFEEKWMWEHLKLDEGDVFIDAGAHVGKYKVPVARIAKLVVSIEPDPLNFGYLNVNCINNGVKSKTELRNVALWDRGGKLRLFKSKNSLCHSLKEDEGLGSVECEAVRLDDLVESISPSSVDLIKIDVEGAEAEAIKGGFKTIEKFKPRIIVEVRHEEENLEEVKKLLNELGYDLRQIRSIDRSVYLEANPRKKAIQL